MTGLRYQRFDTLLGRCGIAWTENGVAHVQLPESDDARAVKTLETRGAVPAEPPTEIAEAVRAVARHLGGEPQDFSGVALDLNGVGDFARRVYAATRRVPAGRTATYGEIAAAIGEPAEARAVGQALGANPIPLIVPCHRIVAAGGRLGGFSAPGGGLTKTRLLALEGVGLPLEWPAGATTDWERRNSRIPSSAATTTSVARPQKSPCATIPARSESRRASTGASAIGPKEQSRIQLPWSVSKGRSPAVSRRRG